MSVLSFTWKDPVLKEGNDKRIDDMISHKGWPGHQQSVAIEIAVYRVCCPKKR